jgi:hypothetical protein
VLRLVHAIDVDSQAISRAIARPMLVDKPTMVVVVAAAAAAAVLEAANATSADALAILRATACVQLDLEDILVVEVDTTKVVAAAVVVVVEVVLLSASRVVALDT